MSAREPFSQGEWYHCYSRGVDKRVVFKKPADYRRFLEQMYFCNSIKTLRRSDTRRNSTKDFLQIARGETLANIGAFCLMPNHFHLLLQGKREGGISAFMQKLGTAYTMYFNIKYERNGVLFAKPFKSKHVHNDRYFQRVLQYIHCNPGELFEPDWKDKSIRDVHEFERKLTSYLYSSLEAFEDPGHHLRPLLDSPVFDIAIPLSISEMIQEARRYDSELVLAEKIVKASP